MPRHYGDFQTPPELVEAVLNRLGPIGTRWARVLEPTCGRGRFISGLLRSPDPPREIIGIEIQQHHLQEARELARVSGPVHLRLLLADLFQVALRRELSWQQSGPLLVIGNPPWVTNAELGRLGSTNRPTRRNDAGLAGLEAMTGASNFDLGEAVWLKLLTELIEERPTVALLCKTSVARRVLRACHDRQLPVCDVEVHRLDGQRWFGASVDACLMRLEVDPDSGPRYEAKVFPDLQAAAPTSTLGFVGGRLVADITAYRSLRVLDGSCAKTWRQGVKHDVAAVMELKGEAPGPWRNGGGEVVLVEGEHLFPLLKGSDLYRGRLSGSARRLILTQRRLGQDTRVLSRDAPRLWAYLQRHRERFEGRRSSIYRGRPPFSMFGLGPYSFSAYKVAVSGLYKAPRFRAIGPVGDRPVMFDDTCYFAPSETAADAALLEALLNHDDCRRFLRAITFPDAKRPITKRVLQRIDLAALAGRIGAGPLQEAALSGLRRLAPETAEPRRQLDEALEGLLRPAR